MKILHLLYESEYDFFGKGGVCIRAYEIYNRIKDKHDITLLCKKFPGAKNGFYKDLNHIFVGSETKNFAKTLISYAYYSTLFVKKYGKDFDTIIVEFSPAIPTIPKLFTTTPIILQVQGYTGTEYIRKYNFLYALPLISFEHIFPLYYNNYIFVNKITAKKFIFVRNENIEFIPNGVSPDIINIPYQEGEYILFIGRIDIYCKGLDLLLKAFTEFNKLFPDIRLIIAGDGRDRDNFKKLLMDIPSRVRKKIEMPGWVEGCTKEETLKKALFVVAPSRYEVQSISVLEALGYCKPVVVSDIQEFSFVKNIFSGFQFRSGDYQSLFNAMKKMVTFNEFQNMGKNGRKWVTNFTWDKIALRYESFLQKVCR